MKILITNDDGVHATGLVQLARTLQQQGNDVFVAAPLTEQSGVGSSITFLRPLFVDNVSIGDSASGEIPGVGINGTPVDCIRLGVFELCPWKPDLVVSGINNGLNAGTNVNFSGTVAGAMTAAALGFKSLSVSLEAKNQNFVLAAESTGVLIERLANTELPPGCFLNVNFPMQAVAAEPCKEFEFVPAETNPMGYEYFQGSDPKSRPYFWATNNPPPQPSNFLTDTQCLLAGKATISVLTSNLNGRDDLSAVQKQFETKV